MDTSVRGKHSPKSTADQVLLPGWEAEEDGGKGQLYVAELSQKKMMILQSRGKWALMHPVLSMDWSETSVTMSEFVPVEHNLTFSDWWATNDDK